MSEWIGLVLDLIVIAVVGIGTLQATRLIRQLRDLRAGRVEMERFVRDFNGAVIRAEAGIKGLRSAARDSGDDLEKLVEKAVMVRDELNFIVGSADGVAERLSVAASGVLNSVSTSSGSAADKAASAPAPADAVGAAPKAGKPDMSSASPPGAKTDTPPPSRAEKELLQVLQKLRAP